MAGLKDVDSFERVQLIRVALWFGPACLLMLSLLWFFLRRQGVIPVWLFVALLVLTPVLTACGVLAIHYGTSGASVSLVKTLYSAGDIAPPRTYPRQDVLIVRGQFREAAEYFRDHLTIEPADNEARLRLADILEDYLNDPAGAERLYLEVRAANPDRGQEMRAANGLIDLYRKRGRRDRLLVELARFRDRYPGTPGADAAAKVLKELKQERRT
ncbi:MAG: tetratricopeptide repeat protein [Gemmatimonadales bacterium]